MMQTVSKRCRWFRGGADANSVEFFDHLYKLDETVRMIDSGYIMGIITYTSAPPGGFREVQHLQVLFFWPNHILRAYVGGGQSSGSKAGISTAYCVLRQAE